MVNVSLMVRVLEGVGKAEADSGPIQAQIPAVANAVAGEA